MTRLGISAFAVCAVLASPAWAEPLRSYDIAAQDLAPALEAFAATSGREVVANSDILVGKRSSAVRGSLSAEAAVERLLVQTGLRWRVVDGAFVIRPAGAAPFPETETVGDPGIVVTGTRIRGAAIASPKVTVDLETVRDQGLATTTEAAQSIPQNFGGGQNPGVGFAVPAASGVNVGGGTSLNLRGLGSDATLTLLNGHRLAYSASRQSIDLSAIPVGIVERIEVVADGASAIYGSDAVAGVANIILRRDMQGLVTTARLGGSTDGGNDQQTYSASAGLRWGGGGGIVAYEYGSNTPVVGRQRDYTATVARGLDLLPETRRHNAALSVHQDLGWLTASLDALYNNRRSLQIYAANATGNRALLRVELPSRTESFLIAPTLRAELGGGWRAELTGGYGEDKVRYQSNVFSGGVQTSALVGCYCNDLKTVELSGDGPLFELPAGPVRLAAGVGHRDVGFVSFRGVGSPQNIAERQSSAYAFGEASVPLLARRDGAVAVRATGALRYERYADIVDVVTPKLGLVVSPIPDFDLKASWGKSFRAPTFLQRYSALVAVLQPAASFGGSGLPAGSAVLGLTGGREDLKPERARSWSVTADIHPRALDGARLELSYFDIRYTDRIVAPVVFSRQALTNPIYADQVTRSPSAALLTQVLANAAQFFNVTGATYDPAKVVAIVDNTNVNAASQHIHGIDGALTISRAVGDGPARITATLNASYLESSQKLTSVQPVTQLAGLVFNPPHFRARGVLGWSEGPFALTGAVNRIGGVTDPRFATPIKVRGMTTYDLTARIRSTQTSGLLAGIELVLTGQNLFNQTPGRIAQTVTYDHPYDSANYSPVGRFVSVSLSKKW
ncbi:TonB-dependent receptor [Novosphingobium sp. Gsoil 351]|uniref:TonB-dependent receptor n=1 Tax=Novosphingobium sp. Gsoil 351 TaxID=2675225 RepID=UPI0018A81B5F|nr:TonB-dependent receptor [Novosphingobium sp. Gsoil 351]